MCHIHGYAKDDTSEIRFGHGEESNTRASDSYWGIDDAFDDMVSYLKKDTAGAIKKHRSFIDRLKGVNKVYSYGFSFSDVDMCYIEEISNVLEPKKVRWYFNTYDWKNNRFSSCSIKNI